ncbi:MAG TPA: SRPBCC family protein [Anaerolineae bacterium]
MIEFQNTIEIERPAKEVFDFLARFENLPKWNYFVLEVKKTSEGPVGVGATYHQVRKTDEQVFRVIEFEPNHTLALKTIPPSTPELEMRFTLQAEDGRTKVIDEWKLDTGRPALLERLFAGRVKLAVKENLGKLKQLLETGRVTLQDGQTATL